MEQILFHLIGDYIFQTDWMAKNKVKSWFPALVHALIYSLLFFTIGSWKAVLIVFLNHLIIDRFSLAKYVIWFKNRITGNTGFYEAMTNFGYNSKMPPFMAFWLYAIADNTLHFTINYLALKYL